MIDLYCKLYVDTNKERSDLLDELQSQLEGSETDLNSISSWLMNVDIYKNEDFDEKINDDFIFFRYIIELYPKDEAIETEYINTVSKILKKLWNLKIRAVASCDYENRLPNSGGYQNEKIYDPTFIN